ncbi:MAG: hypothetical protein ACLU38_00090 [Dysosmobacter sp.]
MGPSGCGKSTLLSASGGTGAPYRRSSLAVDGEAVRGPSPAGGLHAPAGSAVRLAQHLGQRDPGAGRTG